MPPRQRRQRVNSRTTSSNSRYIVPRQGYPDGDLSPNVERSVVFKRALESVQSYKTK